MMDETRTLSRRIAGFVCAERLLWNYLKQVRNLCGELGHELGPFPEGARSQAELAQRILIRMDELQRNLLRLGPDGDAELLEVCSRVDGVLHALERDVLVLLNDHSTATPDEARDAIERAHRTVRDLLERAAKEHRDVLARIDAATERLVC